MSHRHWVWAASLWIGGLCACGGNGPAPSAEKAPVKDAKTHVRTAPAVEREVDRLVEFQGTLFANERATIAAEVDGPVQATLVDLGDRVQQGGVLARISGTEYVLRLRQAEAEAKQAEADLSRWMTIAGKDLVEPAKIDEAKRKAEVTRALADLAAKKAKDAEVRAPFSGEIARRMIAAGDYVRVGTPMFEIVQSDPLKLGGEIPERYISSVKKGLAVRVAVDAHPDRDFKAEIDRISPTVDPKSRTFFIEAKIKNGERLLKPGSFVRATLELGLEKVLIVPEAAILSFAGENRVFVVENDQARSVRVEIVRRLEDGVIVIPTHGALSSGQSLVISGGQRLADGSSVEVQK